MTYLNPAAPWGSPVVDDVPLPPFTSAAEHRRYGQMLALHVALLDDGGPALPTVALLAAIDRSRRRSDEGHPWLTDLEFTVSLDSWFPAPWTPKALADSLAQWDEDQSPRWHRHAWLWSRDPDYSARRSSAGGWAITRHERGRIHTEAVASDRDLVVLWMDHYRQRFALPLGAGYEGDDEDAAALFPASVAVLQSDTKDAQYPYRTSWVNKRAALLAAAQGR